MYYEIEYYKLDPTVKDPLYSSDNNGIDLFVRCNVEVPPFDRTTSTIRMIPLNIVVRRHPDLMYELYPRSSLFSKKGLLVVNSVGVIDYSYDGPEDELLLAVINATNSPVLVRKNERIAQLVVKYRPRILLRKVPYHWGGHPRGRFGSTGGYDIQE